MLDIAAGASFVTATAVKASGAVLIPVVLAGLLRTPRALLQVLLGMLLAGVVLGAASLLAFGLHIPDLSTQSRLVTSESVPNLIGLATGAGGENQLLHSLMSAVLVCSVLLCCWLAWRWRDSVTASGWASVALLLTLSWVLPWYVLWVLPLAALSSSRKLRAAALVVGVYLIIAWAPASGLLWNAIGFHPEKTVTRPAASAQRQGAVELVVTLVTVARRLAPLELAPASVALVLQSPGARGPCRARRAAAARHRQRPLQTLGQAAQRELAVARLRALVLGHGDHPLAGAGEQALALGLAQRRRRRARRRRLPRARRSRSRAGRRAPRSGSCAARPRPAGSPDPRRRAARRRSISARSSASLNPG